MSKNRLINPETYVENPSALEKAVQRLHRGDFMQPETRSRVMATIKGKDTGPERAVAEILKSLGLSPELHVRELPGRPDFVLRDSRIAIFVDGDFWHGWQFEKWRLKLSEPWEKKILENRRRDLRAHAALRRKGWKVVRVWEHQIKKDERLVFRRLRAMLSRCEKK